MKTVSLLSIIFSILLFPLSLTAAAPGKTNIVLIIGDDVGYSDLSPFGSDIDTPNLATLAQEGVAFTNYHTPPACSPTRAQLHNGVDHHLIGLGRWDYAPFPGRDGLPGYEGYLTNNKVSVAELLRDAGYHTYISGKWHQGHESHVDPYLHGFEESYVLLEGGANNYTNMGMTAFWPTAAFTRNGKKVRRVEGDHSDKYWTDELIKMISANQDDEPFYAVLSFQTAHFPLQAPESLIKKYQQRLRAGWEKQRQLRLARQKQLGIVPVEYEPASASIPEQEGWENLSAEDKEYEIKRGAIYAAMIEHHDHHIGRLLQYLKTINEYDNTLFIYVSDNGGAIQDFRDGMEGKLGSRWYQQNFDHGYENIGKWNSNIGPGVGWGMSSNTPNSWHKLTIYEGGISVPMIVRHPNTVEPGRYSNALTQAMDVAATVLDTASVEHPGSHYKERKVFPLQGRSVLPVLSHNAESVYADDEGIVIELLGNGAILMGDWKLMRMRSGMGGTNTWKLFNLARDPQESINLSDQHPALVQQLLSQYERYADNYNIKPVADEWTPRPGSE